MVFRRALVLRDLYVSSVCLRRHLCHKIMKLVYSHVKFDAYMKFVFYNMNFVFNIIYYLIFFELHKSAVLYSFDKASEEKNGQKRDE